MDTPYRQSLARRPRHAGGANTLNDRIVPKRVVRAIEEIVLLVECWKRADSHPRRLH